MTGTIRKRGKGSWELRFDVGRDPASGRRRFRYLSVKGTKASAQRALTEGRSISGTPAPTSRDHGSPCMRSSSAG